MPSRSFSIGAAADNDIVLTYPLVSRHHARLIVTGDGATLEDLDSTNGTYVGSSGNRITRAPLSTDDVVYFGSHRMAAGDLLSLALTGRAPPAAGAPPKRSGTVVSIGPSAVLLGRDPECDQVLDHPMVSWRHARILRQGDRFQVEDLGSTNGTFVNGRQIAQSISVHPGDTIGLGSYVFKLTAGAELERHDSRGSAAIEAHGVAVEVPGKRLLDKVSLAIRPSEFVGLMGPSGAGKSTLMNVLNGYTRPSEGAVLLNGSDLYKCYDMFRGQLGFVPQDDIMHGDLTVGQALYFSARLRLPPDFSDAELWKRIRKVLEQLGLQAAENVLIGSPDKKGISGGQRKRVNLAMELLTDPSVLFLDEPTSGLSSEDTLTVMKLLRQLADEGKTILLTIHQPSLEAFRLMDHLIVVARDAAATAAGEVVYFGPAYPDAVHFFNPDGPAPRLGVEPSPDEVLRGLARQPAAAWSQRYAQSSHRRRLIDERITEPAVAGAQGSGRRFEPLEALRQTWTLVRRALKIKLKDRWNTALLMAQAPIIATLIVLVFGKQVNQPVTPLTWSAVAGASATTIFLLALSALWFGCSNSAREIVGEWAIYRRERMVNLKIFSYLASKFMTLGVLCIIQCLMLLGIVHWGSGLQGAWWSMFGILLLAAVVGVGIGLTISSVARSSEMAIALLPILIMPMVILGGILEPVHKMNRAAQVLAGAMPSRWAFEGLLLLEADRRPALELPAELPQTGEGLPAIPGAEGVELQQGSQDMAERFFPIRTDRHRTSTVFAALGAMLLTLTAAIALLLRSRDLH